MMVSIVLKLTIHVSRRLGLWVDIQFRLYIIQTSFFFWIIGTRRVCTEYSNFIIRQKQETHLVIVEFSDSLIQICEKTYFELKNRVETQFKFYNPKILQCLFVKNKIKNRTHEKIILHNIFVKENVNEYTLFKYFKW